MSPSYSFAFVALCIVQFLPSIESASGAMDWAYTGTLGPSTWHKKYFHCNSAHQSPIDINTKTAIYDKHLKPFKFSYTGANSNYELYNGGANIAVSFGTTAWAANIEGLTSEAFTPASLHFHWGMTDDTGSEHKMDGRAYALEAHLVMYNSRYYDNITQAKENVNGLAVAGVFFIHDDSGTPNPTLELIVNTLNNNTQLLQCNCSKKTTNNTVSIPFFHLDTIFPADRSFFRYKGSLTTPPCTENVLWSVNYHTLKVTTKQLQIFRKAKYPYGSPGDAGAYMAGNHRPVLPLNPFDPLNAPRQVAASFRAISTATTFELPSMKMLTILIASTLLGMHWLACY